MPNAIRVTNINGEIINPILLTDINNTTPGLFKALNKSSCGDNIYFYKNQTI